MEKGLISIPAIPDYATNNAHLFYVLCKELNERNELLKFLGDAGINAVFHYQRLHESPYYKAKHDGRILPNCNHYSDTLVRLPFFFDLTDDEISFVVQKLNEFYL